MSITSKQKQAIRENIICDRIMFKKDGTVEFRRSYFYRSGMDADKFANIICNQIEKMGFVARGVEAHDKWAAWPKTSYFVVTCVIAEKEG